jgi:hypothetical protein
MKKDAEQVFCDLKENVTKYAELRFELLKLNTYEQVSKIIAYLSYGLLLSALTLTAVLFAHLVLGFFLSQWIGSFTIGFGIILVSYILQVVIVMLNRERIQRSVMNKIINAFNSYEAKVEETPSEKENDEPKQ